VDNALRAVDQGVARMGARDKRKTATGDIDFCIQHQIRGWKREDDPPTRVKSIPVQILMVIIALAFGEHHSKANQAITDMTTIAFFYLLWSGEYTGTTNDGAAFRLCDLQLWVGNQAVDLMHATEAQLIASTSASLVFATQKNGVQGEVVNHACSRATHCCSIMALVRRVIHLQQFNVASTTPIATYYESNRRRPVTQNDITLALHHAIRLIGPEVGLIEADVSARSLRAGGAMALLCAQVDDNIIRLLGRW
jgi:hypothetical protein